MILVADDVDVRLLTVNVMALVSTAMTMPLNTMFSCFLGLGCVVWSVAAGAFGLPRGTTPHNDQGCGKQAQDCHFGDVFGHMVDGSL